MATPRGQQLLHNIGTSRQPVMIVNRLLGGFVWKWADAQLGHDFNAVDRKLRLWRIILDIEHEGTGVYRIECYTDKEDEKRFYMTTYPNIPDGGILWLEWADPDDEKIPDAAKRADEQRWYIVPAREGGFAFVPYVAPSYALGFIGMFPNYNCVRPNLLPYCGYVSIQHTWELIAECESTNIAAH